MPVVPKFCPCCSDYDAEPIPLDKSRDGTVLFCSGDHGENPCGFHYDLMLGKRFHYVDRKFQWFWMTVAIFSLFTYVHCQRREYEKV